MNWWEGLRIARRALWVNRLRSFLTMLGIIVGVASVIAMTAIGSGAQTQIAEQIRSLGANVLMIEPGASRMRGLGSPPGSRNSLTESDSRALAKLPQVRATAPCVRGSAQVVYGNRNRNTVVNGTTADYFLIREWPLAAGRYFSESEVSSSGKVAVIGQTVAHELFPNEDPVGAEIRILKTPFRIIGVLAEKGPSGTGNNQDDIVFVPISAAKLRLIGGANEANRESLSYALVKTVSDEAMAPAASQIESLLRQRHRLGADRGNDFRIINPAESMALRNATTKTFAWLLASVASVSLLVGGISIMNIMLVSVTERTREIGIRLAVGARRRDVRNQFLMEAVTLCLFGGLIGLLVGTGIAVVAGQLAGWPILVGIEVVVFALGFSAAIGVFFGWYPAHKAARLEPVDALRHE